MGFLLPFDRLYGNSRLHHDLGLFTYVTQRRLSPGGGELGGAWRNLDFQSKSLWELLLLSLLSLPVQQFTKLFDDMTESGVSYSRTSYRWVNPVHSCKMLHAL